MFFFITYISISIQRLLSGVNIRCVENGYNGSSWYGGYTRPKPLVHWMAWSNLNLSFSLVAYSGKSSRLKQV